MRLGVKSAIRKGEGAEKADNKKKEKVTRWTSEEE